MSQTVYLNIKHIQWRLSIIGPWPNIVNCIITFMRNEEVQFLNVIVIDDFRTLLKDL